MHNDNIILPPRVLYLLTSEEEKHQYSLYAKPLPIWKYHKSNITKSVHSVRNLMQYFEKLWREPGFNLRQGF